MEKLGNFICKNKWLIVIISFILLIPSAIGYFATRVNYDILVYLPSDIETLKGEHIRTDDFHMGAFSITIVENMANQDLIKLENDFRKIKGVTNVISINDLTGTSIPVEVLPKEIKDKVAKGNTKLVLITFENSTSDDVTLNAVDEMRKIADERVKIGGMSAMVLDTKELFNSQMLLYIVVAVICCIFILEISLDSYLVPILLILNIGIAIIYNMGTNIFLGEICYITKAIAAVLQLGVTTDFSIFLYHKYEAAKEKEKNNDKAMSKAIKETITSVLGSSLTTIAGFLALCTMQLTLGADIGIVMAKGVLLGLICVIILFPALLLVFDKQIEKTKHKNLLPEFKHIKSFATKHYITIFVIFIILLVPSFIAQKKTPVYYKLDTSIPENYGYTQATKALQENYNMMSQSMILVDKTVPNYKINEMVKELKEVKGINAVISASTLSELGIPEIAIPENLRNIYQTDKYTMVIISSIYDIATDELNEQLDIVNDIVDKYDETAIVAGEGPLTKDLVTVTDIDLKNVNYTSIAVIFVIMLLILKSISLPILLVSAIEFAIFINIGIPYVTNSPIPFVASIVIGTIQLGATIDYAILLTTKYLEERKNKKDKMAAVKSALDSSTTSIIVSGMCFFAATFGVGVVSTIDMIGCLCTLMARGAIISMAVVIFVLPSILIIFDKIITKTTLGFKKGRI